MKLKYVNGQLVQEGFDGAMGASEDTVSDVRLDALKIPHLKHNQEVEMKRNLHALAVKKKLELDKKLKLIEQNKKWEAEALYKKYVDRLAAIKVKEKNEEYLKAVQNFNKNFMEDNMRSRNSMTKNPLAGFGSGEGEVYHKGSVHNLKADFDVLKMVDAHETSNTNIDSFKRVESQKLSNYRVSKAIETPKIKEPIKVFAMSNSHPMAQFSRHAYVEGPMGGFCCSVSLPRISVPSISLPKLSLPSLPALKLPEIKLPNISLPNLAMPALGLPTFSAPKLGNINLSLPTIGEVGKALGNLANSDLNPVLATHRALKSIPGVRDVYRDLDNFTGGTFTSLTNIASMPGRALKGEAISKADFVDAATFALKAGLIIGSGGSAAAIIGAASGQLKKGPLGQTELGRTLLGVGEVAGLAYATGEIVTDVVANKAKDEATARLAAEAAKKAGAAGAIMATAAVGTYSNPDSSFVGNAMTAAQSEAKKSAVVEIQKKTGVPVTLATQMVDGKVPTQNDVQTAIVQESKARAATEFEKKTGIPVTLAAQVAQGKMPSTSEIKDKVYTGLTNAPEELNNQIANIDEQMKTAPKNMQVILQERKKALQETIANREQLKQKALTESEKKLDQIRNEIKTAGEEADKYRLTQNELKNKALALRQKALQTTDEKLQSELIAQAELIEKQMLSLDPKRKAAEDRAKNLIKEGNDSKDRMAFEQLAIEHGSQDPKRKSGISTGALVAVGAVAAVGAGLFIMNTAEA